MTVVFAPNTPLLLGCADAIDEALTAVAEADPVFLSTPDKAALLQHLSQLEGRLAELRMRVMASADDVADAAGSRDVASWLAVATREDHRPVRAEHHLATALDRDCPLLRTALRDGHVSVAQARVIAHALDDLPADLDPELRILAEKTLIEHAASFEPAALRRLGRHILDVVDPDHADAAEARRLAADEAHARAKTKLTLKPLGDGTTRLSGVIPDATAARLSTYLEAYTSPRQPDGTTAEAFTGSYPRRLGQAFCQLLEAVDPGRLPLHGGDATTVLVTIGLDQLRADLGVGEVIGGDAVTADQTRRLACTAKILPAVLGGKGEVLDLGRSRRLFTAAQRKALLIRDKTCRAEGCSIPGTWCEAHHWIAWAKGGSTDLADGVLLCSHHHHRIHDPAFTTERLTNGDVRFKRRL